MFKASSPSSLFPLEHLAAYRPVEAIDDASCDLLRDWALLPVNGRADGRRQFQQMNFTHHKLSASKFGGHCSRPLVVGVRLVEKTHQKAGVAINDHSRSSMMIRARSVTGAGPDRGNLLQDLVEIRKDIAPARVHAAQLEYLTVPFPHANGLPRRKGLLRSPVSKLSAADGLGPHKCQHHTLTLVTRQALSRPSHPK
jgi:hypothetical protein